MADQDAALAVSMLALVAYVVSKPLLRALHARCGIQGVASTQPLINGEPLLSRFGKPRTVSHWRKTGCHDLRNDLGGGSRQRPAEMSMSRVVEDAWP